MDDLFRVPVLGWRFGLDALIGLVPGLGDTSTALVSLHPRLSRALSRSEDHAAAHGLNIGIDYVVGSLPIVGDLRMRGGSRIARPGVAAKSALPFRLKKHVREEVSDWLFVGGIIVGLVALAIASATISHLFCIALANYSPEDKPQMTRIKSGFYPRHLRLIPF